MVVATQGRRRQDNMNSQIAVCGETVKSTDTWMCLGLMISNDLTWQSQVEKVVKSCKADGIILSRINYCLEVVSQGRKADLERLQSVQSKAARWVLQTRLQDWSLVTKWWLKETGMALCGPAGSIHINKDSTEGPPGHQA